MLMEEIQKQASPQEEPRISRRKHPIEKKEIDVPIFTVDDQSLKEQLHDSLMKDKEHHKELETMKHFPSDPHPLDRRSGTGRGKEMRKHGAGKHNWGTYQDDFKFEEAENFSDDAAILDGTVAPTRTKFERLTVSSPKSMKVIQMKEPVEFTQTDLFPKLL